MRALRVACWICIAAEIITKRNVGVISLCSASKQALVEIIFARHFLPLLSLLKYSARLKFDRQPRVRGKSFHPQRSSRLEKKELDVVSATSLFDFLEHTGNRLERGERTNFGLVSVQRRFFAKWLVDEIRSKNRSFGAYIFATHAKKLLRE
jgi:hypothetical protein